MDVMKPGEGRTVAFNTGFNELPAFRPAPSSGPALFGRASAGCAAAGASASAAAQTTAKYKRPKAHEPKGAASDELVLYTSRSEGTPFGLAGVPGEQWAGGK